MYNDIFVSKEVHTIKKQIHYASDSSSSHYRDKTTLSSLYLLYYTSNGKVDVEKTVYTNESVKKLCRGAVYDLHMNTLLSNRTNNFETLSSPERRPA